MTPTAIIAAIALLLLVTAVAATAAWLDARSRLRSLESRYLLEDIAREIAAARQLRHGSGDHNSYPWIGPQSNKEGR